MNTIFIFVIVYSVVVVNGNAENSNESKELASTCGNYCYQAIKPVLDHTKYLQGQVNDCKHQVENLTNSDKLKQLVDVWIEQKLENFRNATETQLLKQFQLQGEKVEQKLQDLLKLIGKLYYRKIGSKYYHVEESEELNWVEAVEKCRQIGGNLVSIKNVDELNAIKEKLETEKDYWIGFSDSAKEGEFVDVATGQKVTYFNWHPNEPSNGGSYEHCGELWFNYGKHLMNDAGCDVKKLFICESKNQF